MVNNSEIIVGGDVLAAPIAAFDDAEVLVTRVHEAMTKGDLDAAERDLGRLESRVRAGSSILSSRRERLAKREPVVE